MPKAGRVGSCPALQEGSGRVLKQKRRFSLGHPHDTSVRHTDSATNFIFSSKAESQFKIVWCSVQSYTTMQTILHKEAEASHIPRMKWYIRLQLWRRKGALTASGHARHRSPKQSRHLPRPPRCLPPVGPTPRRAYAHPYVRTEAFCGSELPLDLLRIEYDVDSAGQCLARVRGSGPKV